MSKLTIAFLLMPLLVSTAFAQSALVGFAERDITPQVGEGKPPVWIAGYGHNRQAEGVHDPLFARAMVFSDGKTKIAIASIDVVGLQFDATLRIRERLKDFDHVTVSSTHNHEGPDVIGIWGPSAFQRGVNEDYLTSLIETTAATIRDAEAKLAPAIAKFGTAEDPSLVRDSRLPEVKDGTIRVLTFSSLDSRTPHTLLVQWTCHPECMGPNNTRITADFPWATVAELKKRTGANVLYMTGAVGGLMAPPRQRIRDDAGAELLEGDFEYAKVYGVEVANLADRALEHATPISLAPIKVASETLLVPTTNRHYRAARSIGVLKRPVFEWEGNAHGPGRELETVEPKVEMAVQSEVSCLQLGDVFIANIPGEIYPELVYGEYPTKAEQHVDFPEAALEPSVAGIFKDKKWLLFGLASDELGYIIPKRQWDLASPFAYGRSDAQYGEVNSCGPDVAPILMESLRSCAERVSGNH